MVDKLITVAMVRTARSGKSDVDFLLDCFGNPGVNVLGNVLHCSTNSMTNFSFTAEKRLSEGAIRV